jgi:YbgC/YbaW family acyl-CoA thioester hydrolase
MAFRHSIAVRYGEVDMQRVVFNAHYLAYCDDAVETWFRSAGISVLEHGWDFMLKKAVLEWQAAATVAEVLDIDVDVARWGNTSFDVGFTGTVEGRPIYTCTITYVGVEPGTTTTKPCPPELRALLGS